MSFSDDITAKLGLDITSFEANLKQSLGLAGKLGKALGLAFGAREVFQFGTQVVNATTELRNFSEGIGASTEFVNGLRDALEDVGSSSEKADSILEKFSETIGEAAGGKTQLFDALKVSIIGANGEIKSMSDLFREVLENIQKIGSEAERNAVLKKFFGRSGTALNRFGSVDELNAAIEDAPKVTPQQISAAEHAKAGIKSVTDAAKSIANATMEAYGMYVETVQGVRPEGTVHQWRFKRNAEKIANRPSREYQYPPGLSVPTAKEQAEYDDKVLQIQKQIREEEKKQVDDKREKLELSRKERDEALKTLRLKESDTATAKADRYKFTLQDIAQGGFLNPRGWLGARSVNADIMAARRVMFLEQQARWLEGHGMSTQAGMASDAALRLRGTISGLNDSERFPFKQQARDISESKEHLADLRRKVSEITTGLINNSD